MKLQALLHRMGLRPPLPPPRPALFLAEGWVASPEDGPPFNAELQDVAPPPACTCGAGACPGWEHRWPTTAHGVFAAQPGCPLWSRMRRSIRPPKGGSGVRPALAYVTLMRRELARPFDTGVLRSSGPEDVTPPTPEQMANGTCHPDPDHGCTARPPRPAPTPVPGPGRKVSR